MEAYQSEGTVSYDFTRRIQLISSQIQHITRNVTQINRSVSSLGTSQDTPQLRLRLQEMQHDTHALCQSTMQALKAISSMKPPMGASAGQMRQWKLQNERLTNDFSVVLNNFQSAQRAAVQKEKASVSRAKAGGSGASANISLDSETQPTAFLRQSELQIQQDLDSRSLQEREHSLRQLESDILDVNQIFKDLAVMVHEQGEIVDSIEANVDSAVLSVSGAGSNLRQAAEYQRKLRRKQIICSIVLIAVVIILALIIYLSTRSGGSTR